MSTFDIDRIDEKSDPSVDLNVREKANGFGFDTDFIMDEDEVFVFDQGLYI